MLIVGLEIGICAGLSDQETEQLLYWKSLSCCKPAGYDTWLKDAEVGISLDSTAAKQVTTTSVA